MKKNVGTLDQVVRIVLGIALLVYIIVTPGPAKWWGFIGLIPLLTGIFGSCPVYTLLGVRTS